MTNIEIPNSVTSIENHTFFYCTSLANITIPNSVTSIKYNAFYNCSSLTSIEIPNSVTNIESSAFSYCTGLKSIVIPNGVTVIRMHTFAYCENLTSIEIPNSVTNIEFSVFYGCRNLTEITCLATTPPTIYYDTFSNYNADLYVPAGCKSVYETTEYWEKFNIIEDTNAIEAVADEHEAEYFNLQGLPVANPEKGELYIIKRGNKVSKSIVR